MKFVAFALCTVLNTFIAVVVVANSGVEHDGLGVPSHLSPESGSNSASSEHSSVQICILMVEQVEA